VGLQHRSFLGRTIWDRFELHVTDLSALFEVALDRRDRDHEAHGNLRLHLSLIDSSEDALPYIL